MESVSQRVDTDVWNRAMDYAWDRLTHKVKDHIDRRVDDRVYFTHLMRWSILEQIKEELSGKR